MVVPSKLFLKKILADAIFHQEALYDGWLDLLKLALFTNDFVLNMDTLYADLTKPTYTGYADLTGLVASAVYQRPDTSFAKNFGAKLFQMGDAVLPTVVYGYFVYSTAGTVLYWSEKFPNPVTLVTVDDAVNFIPEFALPGADWGEVTMV